MNHKSWSWTVILAFVCGMTIIKVKADPIVFKSDEEPELINRNSKSLQQVKRNVDQSEQQWLTKSIPVSAITTSVDATPSPQTEVSSEPTPPETTQKTEVEIEEKQATPVIAVVTRKLVLQLGQTCDPSGEKSSCSPENSACLRMAPGSDVFICDCIENYEGTPSGVCVRGEGSPCNYKKDECSQSSTYLSCINSRCVCEKSDVYNPVTKKCEAKVGGTCFGEKVCIANSYCSKLSYSDFSISPVGVCECKKGFVESENSICLRAYGRTCSRSDECDHLNLVCREGTCHCSDSLQRYDFKSKSCRSVVGAECSADDGDNSCVDGAICKITNRKLSGRCVCMSNLIQSEYRTCVRSVAWFPNGGYNNYNK